MFFKRKTKIKRPLSRRIINYFIGTGVGLIVILLIAFGYSQTSSFRNWLREFVIEQVKSSTNGELAIENLDGTIFTSLVLSHTLYTLEEDTLFSADRIELKVSPLRIFLKTIYVRKLEIDNADISLIKDENGELNISKITTPSEEEAVKDTVTKSEPFSWKIDIADLKLNNVNFKHQTRANKKSTADYPQPEMDDFRLEKINLSLSAIADIPANEFALHITKLSAKPNLAGFNLLNLSGNFVLLDDIAGVTDLRILTERSNISVNAAISDFSPFTDSNFNLQESPVKVELDATNINLDDLTNFISGTDLLKGSIETHLDASGTFDNLVLNDLRISFNETSLQAKGYLENILGGTDMTINTQFRKSYVNQDDVNNLLYKIDIPVFKDLGILEFDTLYFDGKPLDFDAGVALQTRKGRILARVSMDLSGEEILYDYKILTNNLDLESITGLATNLNLKGDLKGRGFSPENLETSVQVNAVNSTIGEITFSDFNLDADGSEGIINTEVSFKSLETFGRVNSTFNFTDTSTTRYNFDIALNGFNIDDYFKESGLTSDFNLKLTGDGENFDQDKLNLFAVLQIDSSEINDISVDSTRLIADIRSSDDNRVINIISDLADLSIVGEFTLTEIVEVIVDEVSMISSSIQAKIDRIQPPDFTSTGTETVNETINENPEVFITDNNVNVQYLLELKSFELLSLFLGNSEIEVDGEITGRIYSAADSVSATLNTEINQLKYWDGSELFFLSGFSFSFEMNDRVTVTPFDDLIADINLKAKRIFIGSEITDLSFDMNFNHNNAQLDLKAVYDGLATIDLKGSLLINEDDIEVIFKDFLVKYREYELQNKGDIEFSYSNNKFNFQSFGLYHNGGELDLNGKFSLVGDEELSLKINKFKVLDLSRNLLDLSPENSFEGELNLELLITGTSDAPKIELTYSIDSIKIQNLILGSMESVARYSDKSLNIDLSYFEKKDLQQRHSLGVAGKLPIDLSLASKKLFSPNEIIDVKFFADNFDLRFLTGFLPGIKNPNGLLNGNVKFNGPYENLRSQGELAVSNSSFVLAAVNLRYLLDAKFRVEDNKIILSDALMRNEPGIKDAGTMTAYGEIVHQNFNIDKIDIRAAGGLKLFDERTKAVSPSIYGDIAIKTRNEIVFTSTAERTYLSADLILKDGASITYSPAQSAFSNENDKFTYIFSSTIDEDILKKQIDSLIQIAERKKEIAGKIPFDLDLKIEVEKEAKMIVVLSKEFKQYLTAYLGGNFQYTVIDDVPIARGELVLLDGSKLDFIKTFQAEGNVKFLDELDNPYVDVLATYESYYSTDTLSTGANDYDVQVRIKFEGPAKTLTTNFLRNEDNIEVYKKGRNYSRFELDPSKTASDAMFFIIVNKFPEDATLQESNLAVSTAASLAGSIVGTVLNEKLGDVVRSVNVQQVGTETKVSLIGKVEEFRYEIGGTSQVFQDFSRANVKIERPIIFPNLIIRFDRREPSYQSATFSEMINELGLKYSFIF